MKKRKSTRETKNMIQTALWLPHGMHARLKEAGGERGLGDEIRRLLEGSLDAAETPLDKRTDELLDQLKDIARDLSHDEPLWTNRFAYDVFKAAANALISSHEPTSEPQAGAGARLQAIYGDEKPETIGRIIARHAQLAYARDQLKGQ
jgi:hypothetical protein